MATLPHPEIIRKCKSWMDVPQKKPAGANKSPLICPIFPEPIRVINPELFSALPPSSYNPHYGERYKEKVYQDMVLSSEISNVGDDKKHY